MNTKKLLNNVRGLAEITFLMKKAMFHPLKQMGCVNPWDVWMDDPGDCNFQNVSVLLHYIIIFINIMHKNMYLIHISQYMLRYFFVHYAYFRCEFLCSLRPCYVVYEDTNMYNDMVMTSITRRR